MLGARRARARERTGERRGHLSGTGPSGSSSLTDGITVTVPRSGLCDVERFRLGWGGGWMHVLTTMAEGSKRRLAGSATSVAVGTSGVRHVGVAGMETPVPA